MISIIISIFILPKVLSGTIPNYNQAKDSNTQIQYIEKTPSIDSCLLKSGLFTTKFLNSMDYIDIPKRPELLQMKGFTIKQALVFYYCAGVKVSTYIGHTDIDDNVYNCISSNYELHEISPAPFTLKFLLCNNDENTCEEWRQSVKLKYKDCLDLEDECEFEEDKKIVSNCINHCGDACITLFDLYF